VKLISSDKDRFSFQIDPLEKQTLFKLLELYPLIPTAHFRKDKSEEPSENQQLLESSLKSQRDENRKQILAMVNNATSFRQTGEHFEFALSAGQIEWLLQVLNDVNVGCWLALGQPENPNETMSKLNETNLPYYLAQLTTVRFESALLDALNADDDNRP
jgi:hypothetical protein